MNEIKNVSEPLGPQPTLFGRDLKGYGHGKQPKGRVFKILEDPRALEQWQANVEKCRQQENFPQ